MKASGKHVSNMNCALKEVKSDNLINFICSDHWGLIINSNKVASLSDLLVVELYIKNQSSMNANDVQSTYLPQSKLYLKILGILYFIEDTNTPIDTNFMENVIKMIHVFDNIWIAFKPRMVKVSPRSDIVIVIDIHKVVTQWKHLLTNPLT